MSSVVRLAVERMQIPTCVVGPDSPYPPLMLSGGHAYYPYANRLDIRTENRPVEHRVVILENDYVQAIILPDMGGRLFSLFDKVAQQHTFMVPPSVKYQNISVRGAWIAGGIELNFGHRGHNVTTVNPVSWSTRTETDGSVSVFVGAVVRPNGSRWSVRYNLKADRSALDMNILTMAPQVLPGLMYWWTNSAVEVGEQSRFYYFGYKANGHALHSWPITDGLDYSWYRNRLFGSDMFLSEPQRDCMGFYDFSRHHGLAQVASRFLAPGQKYFTWGCDARGKAWDWLLSDSEQTYCEIQRGRLETQGITEPIAPMSVDGWTETWMPINKTEGFGGLENDLVISVVPDGQSSAVVRLLTIVPRSGLTVEAFSGQQSLGRWKVEKINPGLCDVHKIALEKGQACNRVKVTGADGAVIMDWTEFEYKDEDWTSQYKPFDEATASQEQMFLEAERRRFEWWPYHIDHAIPLYEKILAQDPGHTGALHAMAEIDIWRGRFDQAEQRLTAALTRRSMEPDLQMLLGWTQIYMDKSEQAFAAFMLASRYERHRKDGLCGAIAALLKMRQFDQADRKADELLALYPNDRWAMLSKVMTARKADQKDIATRLACDLLAIDPLWSRATAEAMLLGMPSHLAEGDRKIADDTITAAGPYLEMGLWDDAAAILSVEESDETFSPALRLSHLLYAQHMQKDKSGIKATLRQLREAPIEYAHPWSVASLIVLTALTAEYPEESIVQAMFGTILASRKRPQEARDAWKKAADLGLDHAVVYRNLAVVEAHLGQTDVATGYYRKAWKLCKNDLSLFTEFDRFLASQGLHKDRDKLYQQLPADAKDRSMVALRRVPQLLDLQRYDEALEELRTRTLLAGEGGERMPRIFYLEAIQGKAVELMNQGEWAAAEEVVRKGFDYPRNLNVGRQTVHPSEAMLHYLLGFIAEMTDRLPAARDHFLAAVSEVSREGAPSQAFEMLAWLAMGNWPKAMELAHRYERIGRGEVTVNEWTLWANGRSCGSVGVGFALLVKGRIAQAKEVWTKAITEQEKDARWIRPNLLMSDALLGRMYRSNASFIQYVHDEARRLVPKVNGPKPAGTNGDNACTGKAGAKSVAKSAGAKKVKR